MCGQTLGLFFFLVVFLGGAGDGRKLFCRGNGMAGCCSL